MQCQGRWGSCHICKTETVTRLQHKHTTLLLKLTQNELEECCKNTAAPCLVQLTARHKAAGQPALSLCNMLSR